MLKEGELVGLSSSIARRSGRSPTSRSSWSQNFASQAVIAIENTRLLNELRESLAAADRDRRGASRSSASSPGDLQPVFETMLENRGAALRGEFGIIFLYDGECFRLAATSWLRAPS